MKIYVSSKFERKEDVRKLYRTLISAGHSISYDWTTHKPIKPYKDNQKIARIYSEEEIEGIRNCDVFIVLSDEGGTAMHIELGIALMLNILNSKPKIYVIGEHNARASYYFLPQIERKETVKDVVKELGK